MTDRSRAWWLFIASFLGLYFELFIIRYVSTEIRTLAYFKNLPLIACFLGLGVGMVRWKAMQWTRHLFPFVATALLLLVHNADLLNIRHLRFSIGDYFLFGAAKTSVLVSVLVVTFLLGMIVAICIPLGSLIGEGMAGLSALRGYGINLAGSLAGILCFTATAFLEWSPLPVLAVAVVLLVPFYWRQRVSLALLACMLAASGGSEPNTYWSPYYRVDVQKIEGPESGSKAPGYFVDVNYDYHQAMLDLTPEFLRRVGEVRLFTAAARNYNLPYELAPRPSEVLVVGAGTGNDTATALRHGAEHVDAVEIDPVIIRLGRELHPERPYDSPKVTVYNTDARAFLKAAHRRYDLIIFAYLDSHTVFSSLSSLRLDNYVYTAQAFREARRLLKPGGTLSVSFASGEPFVEARMYNTLTAAFGTPPRVFETGYDGGQVFVEGAAKSGTAPPNVPDVTSGFTYDAGDVATDNWPFLYLKSHSIPAALAVVLLLFLGGAALLISRTIGAPGFREEYHLQVFLLGAGFLLLETKSITEMALLFGSTWSVNAIVIAAFLTMALLANVLVSWRPISMKIGFAGLFAALLLSVVVPYDLLNALSFGPRVLLASVVIALPVFFSGMVFSTAFQRVASPDRALGINLLGAIAGGTLENLVLIAGTKVLGVLAIVIYLAAAVSALALRRDARLRATVQE
jgi:SAM-dependent methyltransferase